MRRSARIVAAGLLLLAVWGPSPRAQSKPPLSAANIDDIATLLKLEDIRQLDGTALARILKSTHPEVRRRAAVSIGRIADAKGLALLEPARADADLEVRASVVFATGQLRQPSTVEWLGTVLSTPATPPVVAREAAQALGKIQAPEARAALAKYLAQAPATAAAAPVVGEALLSWGRFMGVSDIAPVVRWITSQDDELRWRAAWALFRPRDPAAIPHLITLMADPSGEVRYWAVRGLAPAAVDAAKMDRSAATQRLERIFNSDKDRRVRTEALRVLVQYDDERAFLAVANALYSPDTWLSVSAAEAAGRFVTRARPLAPLVLDVAGEKAPTALRITCLNALVTLAPIATKTFDLAASLAKSDVGAARSAAIQALTRLGDEGLAKLKELAADPAIAKLAAPGGQTFEAMAQAAIARAGGAGGAGAGGGGRGNRGAGAGAARTPRPDSEYRQLVERWIVPAYTGAAAPRAVWVTPKGEFELELYAGDAPFGAEHFMRVIESGDLIGTEFTRLVPNFVAQQQAIRNASTLRDEVNRRGLTRGNLSWASGGLDTGRPGYTLGHTPQPHNEGNFTSLGRVIRGMDVVDKLELGDRVTAARVVK